MSAAPPCKQGLYRRLLQSAAHPLRHRLHHPTAGRGEVRVTRCPLFQGKVNVTSTYLEGCCCRLAQHGYSRDHRADRPQIVIGLMCTADGCPVAVEVFEGNTVDPMTLAAQIDKLKQRFKLQRVVMVGDRGLLTSARIEQTLRPAGL